MNQQTLAPFIWNIADLLLGAFKSSEYGRIILPFTVLRRLECVLEPTRDKVRSQFDAMKASGVDMDLILPTTAGATFYNVSQFSLGSVGSTSTRANLEEVSTADLPRYLLQPGDVLMNEGGDFDKLGRGHVWHGEIEPCIHQNHVFAVRPHGVSSEWLNTFTSSAAAQFYFMGRSKQSTNLASISSSNLMELAVPLPSEEEQRLILDGLHRQASQVNALLAQTERSIELLKERRSALITAAVTGQIDLRDTACH